MKKNVLLIFFLLLLGAIETDSYAQTCLELSSSQSQSPPSGNCHNCGAFNYYMNNLSDSTDTVAIVRVNWVYTKPSNGPGVYKYCNINHAIASLNDGTLGINALFGTMLSPAYTTNPAAPFVRHPRIQFVLNSYKFVTDDALYYGPDMPNNAYGPQPYCVPPTSSLNSGDGLTIIWNVDTNTYNDTFNHVRAANGYYGVAGGIGASYLNIRAYTDTPSCLVNPTHQIFPTIWWAQTDLLIHEIGHCFGLVHSDGYLSCIDDYFQEGYGTWGGGNNIMGYNYTHRHYLSPKQIAKCHYTLVTQLSGLLVNNPYFTVDHKYDINITSNTTWTTERHMKGNVTVKSGKTLTIQCRVSMLQDGKIIVEKGARLVIDGGEVTNVMGRLWRGIEIEGTPGTSHFINNQTGYCTSQGIVEIKNNAIISNAWFGVFTSRTNDATMALTANTGGGIVIATESSFINNLWDIFFWDHPLGVNRSVLTKCTFSTTSKLNKDKDGTTVPTPHEHVKIYGYIDVHILGCNFAYSAGSAYTPSNRGVGVYSTDAAFTVDQACSNNSNPCTSFVRSNFKDLRVGVWVDNFNPNYVVCVYHSDFYTQTYWDVIAENSYYFSFIKNYVSNYYRGLYLYKSKYYNVRQNDFVGTGHSGTAITVCESQLGSHQIYANNISGWGYGINVQGNNGNSTTGLKMNCNDFTADYNQYDIVMTAPNGSNTPVPTVCAQQSPANVTPQANNLVRNLYGAPYFNSTMLNKWWVHSSNQQTILHACNSSPASANPLPQVSAQVWVIPQPNMPLNYTNDCLPNPPSTGGNGDRPDRLSNMNAYLTDLKGDNKEDQNHYEIEATVSSKLNIYLSDTVHGDIDSAIAILERNEGNMDDADIQLIFAYMRKGDYSMAQDKTDALGEGRKDWQDYFDKTINIAQRDNGMYSLLNNADDAAFIDDYATSDGRDGQASAQAIMRVVFGTDHDLPVYEVDENQVPPMANPDTRIDGQLSDSLNRQVMLVDNIKAKGNITIYPNPFKSGFTIYLPTNISGPLVIEIRDLLGRLIYTSNINSKEAYIPSDGWKNGMYLITVLKDGKEAIYKNRIIKQ